MGGASGDPYLLRFAFSVGGASQCKQIFWQGSGYLMPLILKYCLASAVSYVLASES